MTEFGMVTQAGEKHISRGTAVFQYLGAGTQRPRNFFGTPTYAQTVGPKATKFGMVAHMA